MGTAYLIDHITKNNSITFEGGKYGSQAIPEKRLGAESIWDKEK